MLVLQFILISSIAVNEQHFKLTTTHYFFGAINELKFVWFFRQYAAVIY